MAADTHFKCVILTGMFLLSGCASGPPNPDQVGQKEADGQMLGSILGGAVGNFLPAGGSVASQVIKTNAGTIGTLIGGAIGAALDEEDRRKLEATTLRALTSGSAASFSNTQSGVKATVTPTAISRATDGKQCRSAKQDVVLASGKVLTETVKACKNTDGAWEV